MLAILPSVTTAMSVKKTLERKGISAEIVHPPKSVGGCGYCIKFDEKHLPDVKQAVGAASSMIKALLSDRGEPL